MKIHVMAALLVPALPLAFAHPPAGRLTIAEAMAARQGPLEQTAPA